MKLYETLFEEYLQKHNTIALHPKLKKIYTMFPKNISDMQNTIFYGPSGIGKYTQALASIQKYSPSKLKYEKKMSVSTHKNKNPIILKISDIHFEVDLSLLGCNSKLIWNEIYNNITDAVLAKKNKIGIILCKNFHEIHSELLDIFYSYIQINNPLIQLKYILLTEQVSFIPYNITKRCKLLSIPRANRSQHIKCFGSLIKRNTNIDNIDNLKKLNTPQLLTNCKHTICCNKIIDSILSNEPPQYAVIREQLYNLLIYNIDVYNALWFILSELFHKNIFNENKIGDILIEIWKIMHYYNNNYRPIYHLERFVFYLLTIKNEHKSSLPDSKIANIFLSASTKESVL